MYSLPEFPASYVYPDGTQEWHDNNSNLHNVNGPAIIHNNGINEWIVYVEDRGEVVVCCAKEFQKLTNCTDEHIALLEAKYGKIC